MTSFQTDYLLTINNIHEKYIYKIDELFNNKELLENIEIDESNKLIEYLKKYKDLINSTCLIIDKINKVKQETDIKQKIENELIVKMLPIMNIYRTLLYEKYITKYENNYNTTDDIEEQD